MIDWFLKSGVGAVVTVAAVISFSAGTDSAPPPPMVILAPTATPFPHPGCPGPISPKQEVIDGHAIASGARARYELGAL